MSLECSECERDLRGGHARTCSRYRPEPAHCSRCEYDEAEGGLIAQCPACRRAGKVHPAIDGFLLPGTDEEQAIIDERIAEEMVALADHFPGATADLMSDGQVGHAAMCYARQAGYQCEGAITADRAALRPADWPLSDAAWTGTTDPRENYAKAVALLWLEMIRLERLAAEKGGAA